MGETKRSLKTHIDDYKNNKNSEFVVFNHQSEFNHEFNWKKARIIDYECDYKKK